MYSELEQFLGRGNEKVFWLISQKNLVGFFLGMLSGQRLGELLFGEGSLVLLCTMLGVILGVAVTFQHHGLLILRRLVIRARFYLQRAIRPRVIDAEAIFPVITRQDVVIRVERHDGTPVIVPERTTR